MKYDDKGGSGGGGGLPREGLISVLNDLIASLQADIQPKLDQIRALEQIVKQEQDSLTMERFRTFTAQQR